ncbi:DUF6297 family protein [Nocardioides jishulii]|uniref:DUF6297 family protein n=1 Tax=Nocardioides jishulii TaxID=2575440 RepID=UPI0014852AFC|nr:DUF6297 family protein [Nocardioides jishulii]
MRVAPRRPDRGGDDVAAHEAVSALARARARRRDGAERFTDLYVWVFSGVLFAVWIVSFARETFTSQVCTVGEGAGCVLQQHPASSAVAVAMLGLGALVLAGGAVGPVSAERAAARWLLGTTAERAVLLRGPLAATVGAAALGGTLVGLLTALAAQGGGLDPVVLALGAVVGALGAAVVQVALVVVQPRLSGRQPGRGAGAVLVLLGLTLLSAVVTRVAHLPEPPAGGWRVEGPGLVGAVVTTGLLLAALVVALVVALVLLRRPGSVLAELSDAQLARGREVVDAVADSALMMDATALTGLQRRRADLRGGRHPSRPLRWRGAYAFLVADLRLVRRRWRAVAVTFAAVPAIVVAGEGFGYGGAVLLAGVVAAWSGRQAGQGLRTWLGSPGLRRAVVAPTHGVTLALTLLPALASACVAMPAVLLVDGPWWGGLHLAVAGLAATIRSSDPVPAELGAVVTTPAGALPIGVVRQLLHGPDVAVALALVLVLVGEPWILLTSLAALGWQVSKER